jgi:putative colanic acid biosynthesis UDP-glucose lipid carrier transferase
MKQRIRFNEAIKPIIITGDLVLLNVIFTFFYCIFGIDLQEATFAHCLPKVLILVNITYLLCNYKSGIIINQRLTRPEHIVLVCLRSTAFHAVVFISLLNLSNYGALPASFLLTFYFVFLILLTAYRLLFRYFIKKYRRMGGNSRTALLIGSAENMQEIYHAMINDPTSGFRVMGYFAETISSQFPEKNFYLGTPDQALNYLHTHQVDHVYCGLSSTQSQLILPIINYCENHLIRFYSVPNVRNYLKRRMYFVQFGSNVPVLAIRREPLGKLSNRFVKRIFDIVFSGIFLCTLFPIISIIVGLAIKLTSPGPIFFRQKRSGQDGREFMCYKFRSMRINKDSDSVQATKDDPRKTRLGNFLRKTNIDELPQFINVFLGDMSVVGPRPHMLKHTQEYSQLIDKFMVRHLVRPGITGWAQVTGYRGETNELWKMEGRVERDIWYLEHWSFLLDLYIIFRTLKNAVQGEKKAY